MAKEKFSSFRTKTRTERVLKWYLDRGFVLGRWFVLRAAFQGAVSMCFNVPLGTTSPMTESERQKHRCDVKSRTVAQKFDTHSYCFVAEVTPYITVTSYRPNGPEFETRQELHTYPFSNTRRPSLGPT